MCTLLNLLKLHVTGFATFTHFLGWECGMEETISPKEARTAGYN